LAGLVALVAALVRPTWHFSRTLLYDDNELAPLPSGYVDDASRLNPTKVAEVWDIPIGAAEAEAQLAVLLRRAAAEGLKVSIAGSRHSMGGHSIYPDGIVVNMLPFNRLELDERRELLRAGAGATWEQIVPFLEAHGRSVEVMQSNNSFSVGGSLSVNCHGWQPNRPPIASTVQSLRIMLADGKIVRASRSENTELFSLVLGGYGLFGIVLEAELRIVPNEAYRAEQLLLPSDKYIETFRERVAADAGLVYGRLSIVPGDGFLREAILVVFHREADAPLSPLSEPGLASVTRAVFRGSADSDYGKKLRWDAETRLAPHVTGRHFSRNQLLNESVEVLANRSAATTDILHEYFVPPEQFNAFVERVREIVPRHRGNLLNVTVRNVLADSDSFLRYADRDVFALVMLFVQPRTPDAELAMQALTRDLIDAAVSLDGRYYLPYRLHATAEQFAAAYPQAEEFFALKRKYDPQELFQNQFYLRYGRSSRGRE
jgi:FAD/FMN-containing dehydrogenase